MSLELLNPHVRHARRHMSKFAVRRGVSICYDARLFYFENTEGSLSVGDVKYNISNKTAVYLPPLSRYMIKISVNDSTVVSVFNFDLTKENTGILTSLGTPTLTEFDESLVPKCTDIELFSAPIVKRSSKLSSHISSVLSAFNEQHGAYLERTSAYMKLALLEMICDWEKEYSPLVNDVMTYVSEHISDTNLTNTDIAAHFNYHPYYVNRVIKRELGVSLRSYVISARLDAACLGLVRTNDSISTVAERSGFPSPSYFVKMFKEREGVTPLEYRRANRSVEL